jgi:hypothetical protein
MEKREKRIVEIKAKIARIVAYRDDLNDTNEDTHSLDQIIVILENELADIVNGMKHS